MRGSWSTMPTVCAKKCSALKTDQHTSQGLKEQTMVIPATVETTTAATAKAMAMETAACNRNPDNINQIQHLVRLVSYQPQLHGYDNEQRHPATQWWTRLGSTKSRRPSYNGGAELQSGGSINSMRYQNGCNQKYPRQKDPSNGR